MPGQNKCALDLGAYDPHRMSVDDMQALYARLHRECPVAHSESWGGFYVFADYEDVRRAAKDWQKFSSAGGVGLPKTPFRNAAIDFDPPEHGFWRDIFREILNPATNRAFEERIADHANSLIDRFAPRGTAELVDEFTEHLPVIAICEMIGIADVDRARAVRRIALDMIAATGDPEQFLREVQRYADFCAEELEERRLRPRADFLSRLCAERFAGRALTDSEIINLLIGFLVAGHHTSTSVLTSMLFHVTSDTGLRDRLVDDPSLIPRVVEETVRLDTPLHHFLRQTTEDVIVQDVCIPAGSEVMLSFAAANRDPDQFPNPDLFKIDRPSRAHMGFGHGIHACVGAQFARLDLRVALEQLLRRLPDVELVGERGSVLFAGGVLQMIERLDVRFTAESAVPSASAVAVRSL